MANGTSGNDSLVGSVGADGLYGLAGDDTLRGDAGNDTLEGGTGNDILYGESGNDTYVFGKGDGADEIAYDLDSSSGKLNTLLFKAGVTPSELVVTRSGSAILVSIAGTTDSVLINNFFNSSSNGTPSNSSNPIQQFVFNDGTVWNLDRIRLQAMTGGVGDDTIVGSVLADTITGGAGNDLLYGYDGNDTYVFGKGDGADEIAYDSDSSSGKLNTLLFKAGVAPSELVVIRSGYAILVSIAGTTDSIFINNFFSSSSNGTPSNASNPIQQFVFNDGTVWNLDRIRLQAMTGGVGDDTIVGTALADTITGGAGNDLLYGYDGNDTYMFGKGDGADEIASDYNTSSTKLNTLLFKTGVAPSELVVTRSGYAILVSIAGTTDSVLINNFFNSSSNGTPSNSSNPIQQFVFNDGTVWNLDRIRLQAMTGGVGDDTIVGTALADTITGGAGNDLLYGYDGNDTYVFGKGDGADEIASDYDTSSGKLNTLLFKAGVAPSELVVTRSGSAILVSIAGTTDSVLINNFFNSSSNGTPSNSSNPIQQFVFNDGTVWNLDRIRLQAMTGGAGDDTIVGTALADTITGGAGNDLLYGYDGNDTYVFGKGDGADEIASDYNTSSTKLNTLQFKAGVLVTEIIATHSSTNSSDLVLSIAGTADSITIKNYFYSTGPNNAYNPIQNIVFEDGTIWTLDDLVNHTFVGTSAADTLTGNAGDDYLSGGAGIDSMAGGLGDDMYVVDSSSDVVTEAANAGIDSVFSTSSFTLSANVEELYLVGNAAANGAGNALNNWLSGNSANNLLMGLAGNDYLFGDAGNDILRGGAGNDEMDGGYGTDWADYSDMTAAVSVDLGVTIQQNTNAGGLDTLHSIENARGGSANDMLRGNAIANALSGMAGNDSLLGFAGNDTLDGGAGNDTLRGGLGNDVLNGGDGVDWADYVDMTASVNVNLNITTVQVTGAGGSDTLTNIENVRAGSANDNLKGNASDNVLDGQAGNDALFGNAGNDNLIGGAGNDILNGGLGNDSLSGGDGNDWADYFDSTAAVSVDLRLATQQNTVGAGLDIFYNIENLRGGLGNDTLNGSVYANALVGQAGNDFMVGNGGNDTLYAGLGNDTLFGGTGNDTYQFNRGDGQDTLTDTDATVGNSDTLAFQTGVTNSQLWLTHTGNDLVVSVIGTTDKVTIKNWYVSSANHVESITAGGKTLADGNVNALVSAMSAFSPPAAGQTTLPSSYQTALNPVIAANWV